MSENQKESENGKKWLGIWGQISLVDAENIEARKRKLALDMRIATTRTSGRRVGRRVGRNKLREEWAHLNRTIYIMFIHTECSSTNTFKSIDM